MKFNLRKIISLTIFSVAIIFTYFNVKAETIVYENAPSADCLSYSVIKDGEKVILEFGEITPHIRDLCEKNKKFIFEVSLQVESLGGQYKPTTIIFDNVEYTYDVASATMTITGREGSVYATAYNFVLNAFNFVDEFSRENTEKIIHQKAFDIALRSGKPYCGKEWLKIYNDEYIRLFNSSDLSVQPLDKIIIKGDVRRIGEEFTVKESIYPKSYSVKVIDMSDSKVDMLYAQAFWRLNYLEKVIFPVSDQQIMISRDCFEYTPLHDSIERSSKEFKDVCTPINKSGREAFKDEVCDDCLDCDYISENEVLRPIPQRPWANRKNTPLCESYGKFGPCDSCDSCDPYKLLNLSESCDSSPSYASCTSYDSCASCDSYDSAKQQHGEGKFQDGYSSDDESRVRLCEYTHKDLVPTERLIYTVISDGEKTTLKFNPLPQYIKNNYRAYEEFVSQAFSLVEELSKRYNFTTIIVDNVEYTYDASSAILSINVCEGSVYAKSYGFVLRAFNLLDESILFDYKNIIKLEAFDVANKSGEVYRSNAWRRIYEKEYSKLLSSSNWRNFITKPLNKIIMRDKDGRILSF